MSVDSPIKHLDKIPPQNIEAEMATLGAMLIEKEAVPKAIEFLTPVSFYLKGHRLIFEAMVSLFEAGEPIDTITLYEELKKRGQTEEVGGAVYLSKLSQNISSAANIEYHAKIIIEKNQQCALYFFIPGCVTWDNPNFGMLINKKVKNEYDKIND